MPNDKPFHNDDTSNDSTAVASASSSHGNLDKQALINKHLAVPHKQLLRRPSNDSLFSGSDITELSFGSTEVNDEHQDGLIRTFSNVSETFAAGPRTWRMKLQDFWIANYGAFLVLLSQMFGCTMNIATRMLETPGAHGEPMHPFQILFVRQSITASITTCYALWSKSVPDFPLGPPGKVRLLLVSRGLFGFLGVFGLYFSLLYLPISEATILTFLAPIGSCYAFSLLLPGETFSRQQQLAGFVSLMGVVFIARPASLFHGHEPVVDVAGPDGGIGGNSTVSASDPLASSQPTSAQHLQAVGVAMIGVVGAIGAMTSIRAIGQRAHPLLSVNYFSLWCTFVSLLALAVLPSVKFRLPSNFLEWGLLSILGFAGFIMQLLLTMGMSYGGAPASEKNATAQEDLEMQPTVAEPQASASVKGAAQSHKKAIQGQIKGSGAKATSMLYTQMLFALASDKIVFDVTPGMWSWLGSALILLGAIWVAADGGQKKPAKASTTLVTRPEALPAKESGAEVRQEEVGLLADTEDTDMNESTKPDAQTVDPGQRSNIPGS